MQQQWIGVVEGGGTKFVCAAEDAHFNLIGRQVIRTQDPQTTLGACVAFLESMARRHGAPAALGIACFGPLQLDKDAADYAHLLGTPKPGWTGTDVLAPFRAAFDVPLVLDTDVAAAALGELRRGAGRGCASVAYVTVGTGIGGAIAPQAAGAQLQHAEMGHLMVRRDPADSGFDGVCPFHRDCLEGLASGPAIQARWGCELSALAPDHPGRPLIAGYLGQLAAAIALLHGPQMLVIGGGVMTDATLLPQIRQATRSWLAGYLPRLGDAGQLDNWLRSPGLGADSALAGAALMARLRVCFREDGGKPA